MSPSSASRYLSLEEAARIIGVHPTTLRRWADNGEIGCLRTPGGHRRFREEDLSAFIKKMGQEIASPPPADGLIQSMVSQTLQQVNATGVAVEPWNTAIDESSRDIHRERGRQLLGLSIQYTLRTSGREAILEDGRRVGRQYGQEAAARQLSLVDTVRAFLFFRETLIRAVRPGLAGQGQYDAAEVHIHRSLREFLDQVLFALLESYEQTLRTVLLQERFE